MADQNKALSEVTEIAQVSANADSAATLLKSLANPHRLMVLCVLAGAGGEFTVSQLNQRVPLSQSALSQHLAIMRKERLVRTRRDCQHIYYAIAEGPALQIIQILQQHYCGVQPDNSVTGEHKHDVHE